MKFPVRFCLMVAATLLLYLGDAHAAPVRQRLQKGTGFAFTVNANQPVRPVNRRVLGVSFFQQWDYLPIYDLKTGEWTMRPSAEQALRNLHLPFARQYWLDQGPEGPAWDLKVSIDHAAEICRRLGIRQEDFVLEPELQRHSQAMSAQKWADAVRYSVSKGYKFRLWEICNEPYGMGGPDHDEWTRDTYVAHVKEIYPVIKAAQPEARVGISAGLGPFNQFGSTQTYDPVIEQAAGYYDFIAPHFYCHLQKLDQIPFERITFEGNAWILNSYVTKTRELLDRYNPGRHIDILDTEWGMHGFNSSGKRSADDGNRNGNIAGALHRAIRLIYYLNEDLVQAAGQWCALSYHDRPGFTVVDFDDDRQFLNYYLNLYFGRYLGDEIVDIAGTCPYYEKQDVRCDYDWNGLEPFEVSLPKAPVLASKSKDGKRLYLIVANGTAAESLPCRVDLRGFRAATVEAKRLTQAGIDAPALVDKESDAVRPLAVKLERGGRALRFEVAARSISFIELKAR